MLACTARFGGREDNWTPARGDRQHGSNLTLNALPTATDHSSTLFQRSAGTYRAGRCLAALVRHVCAYLEPFQSPGPVKSWQRLDQPFRQHWSAHTS